MAASLDVGFSTFFLEERYIHAKIPPTKCGNNEFRIFTTRALIGPEGTFSRACSPSPLCSSHLELSLEQHNFFFFLSLSFFLSLTHNPSFPTINPPSPEMVNYANDNGSPPRSLFFSFVEMTLVSDQGKSARATSYHSVLTSRMTSSFHLNSLTLPPTPPVPPLALLPSGVCSLPQIGDSSGLFRETRLFFPLWRLEMMLISRTERRLLDLSSSAYHGSD